MVNTLFFAPDQGDERLAAIAHGFRMGQRARRAGPGLVARDWMTLIELPLDEVRRILGIDLALDEATTSIAERAQEAA